MTDPQAELLRWLWARGPTRQLRRSADWGAIQYLFNRGWVTRPDGRWRITDAGIAALSGEFAE